MARNKKLSLSFSFFLEETTIPVEIPIFFFRQKEKNKPPKKLIQPNIYLIVLIATNIILIKLSQHC